MPTAQHRKFDLGEISDAASFTLPEGATPNSTNMLYDKLGIARKRGGINGLGATTTYRGDHLGALLKDDGSVQLYSMGWNGALPIIDAINSTTGAFTSIGGLSTGAKIIDGGRPFQHYGFLVWPTFTSDPTIFQVGINFVGGANGALPDYAFTAGGSVVMTAGSKRVTCAIADNPLTHLQVGQIFACFNAGATQAYIGRVTRLVSSTAFDVYPTPGVSWTCAAGGVSSNNYGQSGVPSISLTPTPYHSGKVGMSFQGRILLGACNRYDPTTAVATNEYYPRRVYFSATLLEGSSAYAQDRITGLVSLVNDGWPDLNYLDIPAQEEITAMSPTGFGDALIFSANRAFRLTGNLSTQFGEEQSVTWATREIPNSVGCISERGLQRTPRGVIFAHNSGVYTTDGSSMQPLMFGKIQDAWKEIVAGTGFKIYGSGLIRGNHYYICGITNSTEEWGWLLNLDTLAWSGLGGASVAPVSWIINSSAEDSSLPGRTWGLKWWNQGGAAPSMTGGQLVLLESMFTPSAANRNDSDGNPVTFRYDTRPYSEDTPTLQKQWEKSTIEYKNIGGANCRVQTDFKLDSDDAFVGGSLFDLPRQDVYTVTAATNASPIVVTCGAHDIEVDTWVTIATILGNTNANGTFRVQAVTATTVTLMGSYGNAAYISGGTIKQVDQRDIPLVGSTFPSQSTAVEYSISGAAAADEFELHGITHSWSDREPHAE